jgi:hypothetical protein
MLAHSRYIVLIAVLLAVAQLLAGIATAAGGNGVESAASDGLEEAEGTTPFLDVGIPFLEIVAQGTTGTFVHGRGYCELGCFNMFPRFESYQIVVARRAIQGSVSEDYLSTPDDLPLTVLFASPLSEDVWQAILHAGIDAGIGRATGGCAVLPARRYNYIAFGGKEAQGFEEHFIDVRLTWFGRHNRRSILHLPNLGYDQSCPEPLQDLVQAVFGAVWATIGRDGPPPAPAIPSP